MTEQEIMEAHPQVYKNVYCGFDCPDGWLPVVADLSAEVAPYFTDPESSCVQVKEKFGGLRWYFSLYGDDTQHHDKVDAAVRTAEDKCWSICEVCGAEASPNTSGWIHTYCPTHHIAYQARQKSWRDRYALDTTDPSVVV